LTELFELHLRRRDLGRLVAASVALSGLAACAERREKIYPYARRPPGVVPGVATHYATSVVRDGFAVGVLAESHEGRPTKIEGNPEHPASLGAAGVFEQASVLDLYDPARVGGARGPAGLTSREAIERDLAAACAKGPPPWFVLEPSSSPSLERVLAALRRRLPGARVSFHAPLANATRYAASELVYGRALEPQYHFEQASVVLALGADFLDGMPMSLRHARDFAGRREPGPAMSRVYAAETSLTPTGTLADHRLGVAPSELERVAAAVLAELATMSETRVSLPDGLQAALAPAAPLPEAHAAFVRSVVRALVGARGSALVVAGPETPKSVQVCALLANAALDAPGRALTFVRPVLLEPDGGAPLAELPDALRAGAVGALVFAGTNPIYSAPELELGALLGRAASTWCLAHVEHETARACGSVLAESHYLESWGDARAGDGTLSFVQPLIEPLKPSVSVLELLAGLASDFPASGHDIVRETEHERLALGLGKPKIADFEAAWEREIQRGFADRGAAPSLSPVLVAERAVPALASALAASHAGSRASGGQDLELHLARSPTLYDGRFSENAWLLELPHPLTKQSWGNAALVSPRTAGALGRRTGDVVELRAGPRRLEAPLVVLPGHADGAVTLELGFGHAISENLSNGVGVNALGLGVAPGAAAHVAVRATGTKAELALTEEHWTLADDEVVHELTLRDYTQNPPHFAQNLAAQPTLLEPFEYAGTQWAMTIDLSRCSGCNACVVACQAENNTPVVGKDLVRQSREMYWLRIDRYLAGSADEPRIVQQPMLCQHCEKAPCEYVCPVNATVHSPDGLNEMVYNRCIGTRFCSNNCPYKVRRFNWFDFSEARGATVLQRNPDVTVRERGVMEKCTYCVQRIRRAEIAARRERRGLRPGEVVTACQQTCPTGAIAFGSLDDESSEMLRRRREARTFAALADLGTRPRTRYLAKIRNAEHEEAGS